MSGPVTRAIPMKALFVLAASFGLHHAAALDVEKPNPTSVEIRFASSKDGEAFFDDDRIFLKGASAPDIVRLSEKELLAVFDLPPLPGDAGACFMAMSKSKDDGQTWSDVERIRLDTNHSGLRHARHGSLLRERGGRVRLFFTCRENGRTVIRSALTRNGLDFRLTHELWVPLLGAKDAHAVAFELDELLHLTTAGAERADLGEVLAWIAPDRRRFMKLGSVALREAKFVGCVVARGSRARAYLSGTDGIRTFVTKDGVNWDPERALCLEGGWDPAVIRLDNGSYLMLYCARPRDGGETPVALAQGTDLFFPDPLAGLWDGPDPDEPREPDRDWPTESGDKVAIDGSDSVDQEDPDDVPEWIKEARRLEGQDDPVATIGEQPGELVLADGADGRIEPDEPAWKPVEAALDDAAADENGDEGREVIEAAATTPVVRDDLSRPAPSHPQTPTVIAPSQSAERFSEDAAGADQPSRQDPPPVTMLQGKGRDATPSRSVPGSETGEPLPETEESAAEFQANALDVPPSHDWSKHDPSEFVPKPDFATEINYFEWYETQALQASEDNAFEAYAEIMPSPLAEPGTGPELPELNDLFDDKEHGAVPEPWSPEDHPEWEASNVAVEEALTKFKEASAYDGYSMPVMLNESKDGDDVEPLLINLLLPSLSSHRKLARATLAAAWRTGEDGNVSAETMLDAIRTTLRTARHLAGSATLIEELVAIAERNFIRENVRWAVRQGILETAEDLRAALDLFTKYDRIARDPLLVIRGEHAAAMQTTQRVFKPDKPGGPPKFNRESAAMVLQNIDPSMLSDPEEVLHRLETMTPDDIRRTVEKLNDYYVDLADLFRTGYPKVRAKEVGALWDRYSREDAWAEVVLPQLGRVYKLRARDEAARRATRLVLAMHLFHVENQRWPESLTEISELDDPTTRIDPFTGNHFVYRVGADGPKLYSLSENQRDDGGVHAPKWDDLVEDEHESDDYVFWPPQQAGNH